MSTKATKVFGSFCQRSPKTSWQPGTSGSSVVTSAGSLHWSFYASETIGLMQLVGRTKSSYILIKLTNAQNCEQYLVAYLKICVNVLWHIYLLFFLHPFKFFLSDFLHQLYLECMPKIEFYTLFYTFVLLSTQIIIVHIFNIT